MNFGDCTAVVIVTLLHACSTWRKGLGVDGGCVSSRMKCGSFSKYLYMYLKSVKIMAFPLPALRTDLITST